MEEGAPVPIFDFKVVSDDKQAAGRTLAEAGPGNRVVYDETVWKALGEWDKDGEPIGKVTIEEVVTTDEGNRPFTATFRIKQIDEPIEVRGFVPGNGSGVGKGRGNARHKGRAGSVPFEWMNPKSWG